MTQTMTDLLQFVGEARRYLHHFDGAAWVGTDPKTDEDHIVDYIRTIALTRESNPNLPAATTMNFITNANDDVIAFVGNTAQSAERTKALVGFVRVMPSLLDLVESIAESVDDINAELIGKDNRITELLEHTNAQLMENRKQRDRIKRLELQNHFLLEQVADLMLEAEGRKQPVNDNNQTEAVAS